MLFDQNIHSNLNEEMKKFEAQSAAVDFLLDMAIGGNLPEEQKAPLRIMQTTKRLLEEIRPLANEYSDPDKEVTYETAKRVNEYLGLVRTGIMQFKKTITQ